MPHMPPIDTLGAPHHEHRHHRLRQIASILAALAGAVAALLVAFLIIGTVTPAQAAAVYGAVLLLIAIWLTGIWWRWDSPDMRNPHNERERRGF